MAAMSGRERRLVALTVAGAIAVGGYLYVLEPIQEANRQAAELMPARQAGLERRQAMIARKAALQAELIEVGKRMEAESARLLQGPTAPLAASELQKLVKDVASAANVEVRSERVLATADRSGLLEVPIEITVAGGIRECVDLLYQLERTDKLLSFQDLKLRVISAGQPRDLLTTITVSGYLVAPPPAPAKPADKPPAELGKAAGSKG